MPFRFQSANCIAVGTFNIYIVQPAWLTTQGIIPKGGPVGILSKLDEPGFRFDTPNLRSRWVVTPGRIEVSTERSDEDCGSLVGQVLERLKWTPLKAVGTNVLFHAPLEEQYRLKGFDGFCSSTPAGYSMEQKSLHVAVRSGGHVFNIQLSITNDVIELTANVHTDTAIENDATETGQQAANKFMDHRKQLVSLIGDIFNLSVEYGPLSEPEIDSIPK